MIPDSFRARPPRATSVLPVVLAAAAAFVAASICHAVCAILGARRARTVAEGAR